MVSESDQSRASAGSRSFYEKRQRIYNGLLVFVVAVGLPIVGVPYFRHRLSARVMALKSAMAGTIRPVIAQAGANHEPFPAEYERPAPPVPQPPQLPPVERVFTKTPQTAAPPRIAARTVPRAPRTLSIPPPAIVREDSGEQAAAKPPSSGETELKYQQGKIEQSAYELLLKSNATVAAMVQGSNPSLHFKSWDAANRGEDTYWVRLKFQSEGNPDVEYIWQVKLQTSQVIPLSYNARTIS